MVQPVAVDLEQRGLEQQYTMLQRSVNRSRGRNIYDKSYCLWEPPKFDTIYHAVVLVRYIYPTVLRISSMCLMLSFIFLLQESYTEPSSTVGCHYMGWTFLPQLNPGHHHSLSGPPLYDPSIEPHYDYETAQVWG